MILLNHLKKWLTNKAHGGWSRRGGRGTYHSARVACSGLTLPSDAASPLRKHCVASHEFGLQSIEWYLRLCSFALTICGRGRPLRDRLKEQRLSRMSSPLCSAFIPLSMRVATLIAHSRISRTLSSELQCKLSNVAFSSSNTHQTQVGNFINFFVLFFRCLTIDCLDRLAPQTISETKKVVLHLSEALRLLKAELEPKGASPTPFVSAQAFLDMKRQGMKILPPCKLNVIQLCGSQMRPYH